MGDTPVEVGPEPLAFDQVVAVARDDARVVLSDQARKLVGESRAHVEELASLPRPVYGVSTGFGALATRHIQPDLRKQLQLNIVRSHAAGSGPEVEREVVRAMMLLRLRTLATGRTGV
ncbi:aromatic amino acid lyase, partial [Actinomadura adrarensis]